MAVELMPAASTCSFLTATQEPWLGLSGRGLIPSSATQRTPPTDLRRIGWASLATDIDCLAHSMSNSLLEEVLSYLNSLTSYTLRRASRPQAYLQIFLIIKLVLC